MQPWLKVVSACIASWLFVIAIHIFSNRIQIPGVEAPDITFSLFLAFLGCYVLSLMNTRSIVLSTVSALAGMILGLPLGYMLLAPFGDWLVGLLFPWSNLGLSSTLTESWILVAVVVVLEIFSDKVQVNQRWFMLLLGSVAVMILIHCLELVFAKSGIPSSNSIFLSGVYAPMIWGSIVGVVNIRPVIDRRGNQGGKNVQVP